MLKPISPRRYQNPTEIPSTETKSESLQSLRQLEPTSPKAHPAQLSKLESVQETQRASLCFDLENRPLAYWYDGQTTSEITAFGWKWSDESDVQTMLLLPENFYQCDDGSRIPYEMAHARFREVITSAGLVYGHNIRRHDLPMLNSWLIRLQLPTLPTLRTSDTLKDIPKRGHISASLENLAALYGLEGTKYHMPQPKWEDANQLTPDGVWLARKRVVSDVLLQERLRNKLRELELLKPPRMWNS